MRSRGRSREATIRGTLLPAEWDEEGEVSSLMIEADDGETYLLEANSVSLQMTDYLDEEVKARGIIRRHEGQLYMNVRFFVPVYDTDDDDDYGRAEYYTG